MEERGETPVNYKAIETPASFITQGNTASLILVVLCGGRMQVAIHKCATFCCKSCTRNFGEAVDHP